MSTQRSEVTKIIQQFKQALESMNIKIDQILLFGSHAQANATKYSDIDLIVISKDFSDMDFMQRCEILGRAIAEVMEPIEPLAYTPEEFRDAKKQNTSFINQVLVQSNVIQV